LRSSLLFLEIVGLRECPPPATSQVGYAKLTRR
jgi:hypothetical protein